MTVSLLKRLLVRQVHPRRLVWSGLVFLHFMTFHFCLVLINVVYFFLNSFIVGLLLFLRSRTTAPCWTQLGFIYLLSRWASFLSDCNILILCYVPELLVTLVVLLFRSLESISDFFTSRLPGLPQYLEINFERMCYGCITGSTYVL